MRGSTYVFRFPELAENYNRLTADLLGGQAARLTHVGLPGTNYAWDQTSNLSSDIVWTPQVTNPAPPDGRLILTNSPPPTTNHYSEI